MTARPLPEAVERRLQAALLDAYNHGWAVGARVKAPVGPDNHEAALRAAIAAAMAPGEPVAHRDVVTTWNADHAALSVRFAGPDVPVARTVSVRHDPLVNVDYAEDGSIHSVEVLIPPGTVPGELPIIHGFVGGPIDPFADALAKVDVEVTDRRDDGTPFYTVLGLKEVEAAHRAEVERAVAEEREACARACDDLATDVAFRDSSRSNEATCALSECAAAIRARGVAKPRTGSEAPSASDEGAKS